MAQALKLPVAGATGVVQKRIGRPPKHKEVEAKYGPDKVLAEIRDRMAAKLSLSWALVRQYNPNLVHSAERHFGTWGKAVEAAGFSLAHTHVAAEPKPPKPPRIDTRVRVQPVSLNASALGGEAEVGDVRFGYEDPGFAQVELALSLESVLAQHRLPQAVVPLVQRLMAGDNLEHNEYVELSRALHPHIDLFAIDE